MKPPSDAPAQKKSVKTTPRRRFLIASSIFAGATLLSLRAYPKAADNTAAALCKRVFARNSSNALAFADPLPSALAPQQLRMVHGAFPEELVGLRFYRNGPAHRTYGEERFTHFFDGDGLIREYTITSPSTVAFRSRYVETARRRAEQAAGELLYPAFGTPSPVRRPPEGAEAFNQGNISVLVQGNRTYALWEGGKTHELDTTSLKTIGTGTIDPKQSAFTAHPKKMPDDWVYGFGYNLPFGLTLFALAPDGRIARQKALGREVKGVAPVVPMHDFMVTERYIILVAPPFAFSIGDVGEGRGLNEPIAAQIRRRYDPHGTLVTAASAPSILDQFRWDSKGATHITVLDRNTFEVVLQTETSPFWVFHFANAYEDGDTIRFDAPIYQDTRFMTHRAVDFSFGNLAAPSAPSSSSSPKLTTFAIDLRTGHVSAFAVATGGENEFPQISPSFVGKRHPYTVTAFSTVEGAALFNSVQLFDWRRERISDWKVGDNVAMDEAIVIPTPQGKEYVLFTALDGDAGATSFYCCAPDDLAGGARAIATHDAALPIGLHASYRFG